MQETFLNGGGCFFPWRQCGDGPHGQGSRISLVTLLAFSLQGGEKILLRAGVSLGEPGGIGAFSFFPLQASSVLRHYLLNNGGYGWQPFRGIRVRGLRGLSQKHPVPYREGELDGEGILSLRIPADEFALEGAGLRRG